MVNECGKHTIKFGRCLENVRKSVGRCLEDSGGRFLEDTGKNFGRVWKMLLYFCKVYGRGLEDSRTWKWFGRCLEDAARLVGRLGKMLGTRLEDAL